MPLYPEHPEAITKAVDTTGSRAQGAGKLDFAEIVHSETKMPIKPNFPNVRADVSSILERGAVQEAMMAPIPSSHALEKVEKYANLGFVVVSWKHHSSERNDSEVIAYPATRFA
ncbi:hypothetical protein GCM10009097_58930 [Pigmentiphaga daeguensis]|uniref:Uncharacterized protein n=1 Tax=Pigmentiphaga daeguensis TaxID=414049 RepID=A0ABN1D4U6_9BURK